MSRPVAGGGGRWRTAEADLVVDRDVMVPMRDGVRLETDVYRPAAPGRYPTLVIRSPYGRKHIPALAASHPLLGRYWASQGYVFVDQDCRGRFGSEGTYQFVESDAADGYDTIEWAAAQPWSTGRVGTFGQSFMAMTQNAVAPTGPPSLQAMVPVSAPADAHGGSAYGPGGGFHLSWRLAFTFLLGDEVARRTGLSPEDLAAARQHLAPSDGLVPRVSREALLHLPLEDWIARLGAIAPWLVEHLRHPDDGPYWWKTSPRTMHRLVDVPILHIGGWYDLFVEGSLDNFSGIVAGGGPRARRAQRMIIGPWSHLEPFIDPTTGGAGELDFGPAAAVELIEEQRRWYDHWLKDEENGVMEEPPVKIFVMGINRWRHEHEWPLARTRYTALYLHSDGDAGGLPGDGTLSFEPPGAEPSDAYAYDPDDPVPTLGGSTLGLASGGFDQREIEARPDVLVYSTEVLETALEVTGPVRLVLYATSTACDTDFTAKLVDVRPDGYAQNVCDGLQRARYRESSSTPVLLTPGRPYRFDIGLQPTSHVFLPGHRLRVEVSSSNFPWYDRNPNTGEDFLAATGTVVARQTIHHDASRASHLILPVIPTDHVPEVT